VIFLLNVKCIWGLKFENLTHRPKFISVLPVTLYVYLGQMKID